MNEKKTIKPGKEIIASKADAFRKKLLKIIDQGIKEIVMDFGGVKTVDSMGLGVIIATYNTFEKPGENCRLSMFQKSIMRFAKQCVWMDILK